MGYSAAPDASLIRCSSNLIGPHPGNHPPVHPPPAPHVAKSQNQRRGRKARTRRPSRARRRSRRRVLLQSMGRGMWHQRTPVTGSLPTKGYPPSRSCLITKGTTKLNHSCRIAATIPQRRVSGTSQKGERTFLSFFFTKRSLAIYIRDGNEKKNKTVQKSDYLSFATRSITICPWGAGGANAMSHLSGDEIHCPVEQPADEITLVEYVSLFFPFPSFPSPPPPATTTAEMGKDHWICLGKRRNSSGTPSARARDQARHGAEES